MASTSFVILLSLLPKDALRLIQKCNYSFGYCHRKTFSLSRILHLMNSVVTFRLSCYYRRRRPVSLTFTWNTLFDTVEQRSRFHALSSIHLRHFGWGLARLSLCVLPSLHVPGSSFVQWSQANTGEKCAPESVCVFVCVFKRHWCNRFNRATLFELDVLTPRLLNGFLKWL